MRATAPGSTSNLGPGFDVLGLALGCYVTVELEAAPRLRVATEGEGAELPRDASHLAVRVAASVLGHERFSLRVRSEIPLGRGLGSSAALALAAAAAAGAPDPFALAARHDGHAENAAASFLGGLVAATFVEGAPVVRRLALDERLRFVAVVPDFELATAEARRVLPAEVAFSDAVFNLGRLGLLLAGLADADQLLGAAGEDRLHQGPRSALYPEAPELLAALQASGAVVATWSGAGPTLLGICTDDESAERCRSGAERALERLALSGSVRLLPPDLVGLRVEG